MLVFPVSELPEMSRGKGVRLQRYKDGGVIDVKCFALAEGLSWSDTAGRLFNKVGEELREWLAGEIPSDVVMDPAHDNHSIALSAKYVGEGEDEFADDARFGDDDEYPNDGDD